MRIELDHLFVCTAPGAPEAEELVRFGLRGGTSKSMAVYLSFMRRVDRLQRFVEYPVGIREITSLALTTSVPLRSAVSQRMVESGILSIQKGPRSLLEIGFDGNRRKEIVDFRPHLPLVFQL